MSGYRSSPPYTVVAETRRSFPLEERLAIVAEAAPPCPNVSAVARRHGISPSLLFRWLKLYRPGRSEPGFVPVRIEAPVVEASPSPPVRRWPAPTGVAPIEIVLANGRRVRVGADADFGVLKAVIALLEER